ncbi:lamin tail domain-containing protein [Streptomyces sp. NPDC059398]|uniref:lamin tail domain-containing protein n=1 Tax=Streptomyces sp. NPDC059398 TaxID=3346820 RepID=UPI0036971B67
MSSLSSGSRLAAAVLASGALLAAAAFPAAATGHHHPAPRPERSAVVVGAVHHVDSHGRGHHRDNRANAEWITVTNQSRRAVELRGWTLTDAQHHSYRFPALRLGAHKSVKVHTGHGRNTWTDVYQNRRAPIWDRVDTATLRDARGRVVDVERLGHRHH